ncbi:MAG: hypothetical protein ABW022_08390 [Actinoplanes sp.]
MNRLDCCATWDDNKPIAETPLKRWAGDVPDPHGGVRRLLIPDTAQDPWITREVSA